MKLTNLRKQLKEQELESIVVTSEFNRRYMTNFTGSAGIALITHDKAYFITDFRYVEQAKNQAKEFEIVKHTGDIFKELANLIEKDQLSNLGFEENYISFKEYMRLKDLMEIELIPVSNLIENLRIIKTPEEISVLKEAALIADKTYEHILNFIKAGVTEVEVANELEMHMRSLGATSSSFDIIVASGKRSALQHGVASEKTIETGELVTLDYGALYNGYISDITRTVAVGDVSSQLTEIYDVVLQSQLKGVKEIKAGMTGREADAITRDYITSKGYGDYFGHSTGHGIGLEVHEAPSLSSQSDFVLKKNMAVTVEPGIYLPQIGGCRIEDDIIITETGNNRLTHATKDLIIL